MEEKKNFSMRKWLKRGGLLAVAVVLFAGGWLVGDGRVSVNAGEELASQIATNNPADLSTDGVQEIYDALKTNYDGEIAQDDLVDGLKEGVVAAVGDTYTEYMNEEDTKDFNDDLDGSFEGIGAELGKENNLIVIISPIKGTPADKAGLQPKDIIAEIDGENATEMSVSDAVKKIRGEKGTTVTLTIVRNGEQLEVPIVRESIDVPSVEWRVENGIGIIEISRFGTDTTQLSEKAAREFVDQGVKKVILDMRGNPGGLLDQAVGVSNIWLAKDATVLEEKRGGKTIKTFSAPKQPIFKDVETIAMINEGSASASEIVAGALKDNGAATLLGAKSYGKGSVQQLIDLASGGSLKVTIARWYTPQGKNIDKEGIEPDMKIDRTVDDIKAGVDPQLDAAKKELAN